MKKKKKEIKKKNGQEMKKGEQRSLCLSLHLSISARATAAGDLADDVQDEHNHD